MAIIVSGITDLKSLAVEQDHFIRYQFGDSGRATVPSLVYIRPDDLERVQMLVGPDAEEGERRYPIRKGQMVFGNLKSLFKRDLVLRENDAGWRYQFDRNLGFADTNPVDVTREFFRALLLQGFKCISTEPGAKQPPIYIGKPAYSEQFLEKRYEKRIRQVFGSLKLSEPVFVYEPYAVYYYCRFLLRWDFLQGATKKGARILVIDHGGGTINTCIVEVNKKGKISTARPKSPQANDGGGSFIDQYILRKKMREGEFPREILDKLDRNSLTIPRLAEVLSEIEKVKVLFSQGCLRVARSLTVRLGIPNLPKEWTFSLSASDIEEAFNNVWDRKCRHAIAGSLGSDDSKKIDYVILSGGTCRLDLHEKYLRKDFGSYIKRPDTTFINISREPKPVAMGLCVQGILDKLEAGALAEEYAIESPTKGRNQLAELEDEDLSDYVSRDIVVRMHGDRDDQRVFGQTVLAPAGLAKHELWDRERRANIRLEKRLPTTFQFSICAEDNTLQDDSGHSDHAIHIRRNMAGSLERKIDIGFLVNEEGVCKPRFYLAPSNHPTYYEPDKETFRVTIPELARGLKEKKPGSKKPESPPVLNGGVLGFDFGTSNSAVFGLDFAIGLRTLSERLPFFTDDYIESVATSSNLDEEQSVISYDDSELLQMLHDVDADIARTYNQVIADLGVTRYSYKGTAAEIRSAIEMLLDKLAPQDEVLAAGLKPDPQTKLVGMAARAAYIIKKRRAKDTAWAKKCAEPVNIIDTEFGNLLRGVYSRASETVHSGAVNERQEVMKLDGYFRVIVRDLLRS